MTEAWRPPEGCTSWAVLSDRVGLEVACSKEEGRDQMSQAADSHSTHLPGEGEAQPGDGGPRSPSSSGPTAWNWVVGVCGRLAERGCLGGPGSTPC